MIDVVETSVGRRTMGALVSCRRKWLAPVIETIVNLKGRLYRAEPGPCGLLRLGSSHLKAPRSSKLSARFFLGERDGLAMLVANGIPLHWRTFELPNGAEPAALMGAFVALRMQARNWRVEGVIDSVLIHGRPDLAPKLVPAELKSRMQAPVFLARAPGFEPASIARGLAMGGLTEEAGFDLARTSKPLESIPEIFPWTDLVLQAGLLGAAVFLMADRAQTLDSDHARVRKELAKFKWLGDRQQGDLEKEKKTLEMKDKTAEAFLASRVYWSNHLRDVASRLPGNTKLTELQGQAELEALGGKGPTGLTKKLFVMKLQTPIPSSGLMPREIDETLETIRDHSHLRHDFPLIEVKDIKTAKATEKGGLAIVTYNIVCMPAAGKPAPAKPSASAKKE